MHHRSKITLVVSYVVLSFNAISNIIYWYTSTNKGDKNVILQLEQVYNQMQQW